MNSWYALLVVSIVFMAGVIAGCCYLWYEHNALIRKVQKMEHQLEEHDGLIQQIITYQEADGLRILELEKNAGYSETQSDDVLMGGR